MKRNQFFSCKGIKALLLVIVMLLGFSAESWGAYVTVDGIVYYTSYDGTARVLRFDHDGGATISSTITIPSTIKSGFSTYTVTEIGFGAFKGETNLKTVNLPASIRIIIESAFQDCTNLTTISGLNNVRDIDQYAFKGCTNLTHVDDMNSVEIIRTEAFSNCTSLYTITLPPSLKKISSNAFEGSGLWDVKLSGEWNVEYLGSEIFKDCKFSTLPDLGEYGKDMFVGNPLSGSISIPSKVTKIPARCFKGCQIRTVSLHNTEVICDSAFYDCPITTLVLPSKVEYIGHAAFNNVKTLNINSPTIAGKERSISLSFALCPISKIAFSDDIDHIGVSFARGKSTLTTLTLPKSGVLINSQAFQDCPITGDLTLNDSEIREGAFANTKLSNVTLTGTKMNVMSNAFANTNLKTLTRTSSGGAEHAMGDYAFNGATITSVNIDRGPFFSDTFTNCDLGDVVIDNTTIPERAFLGNRTLESVVIGPGCTIINEQAFNSCKNLKYVNFGSSRSVLTQIEEEAFANCSSLNDITLDGLFLVSDNVFSGSMADTDITIKNMTYFSENSLAGRKWRTINVKNQTPKGKCLKNTTVKWINFENATTLGGDGILDGSTVEALYAPKLQDITQKDLGTVKNLRNLGTIQNEYISTTAFDLGCVYSADRKTLLFICPGINEASLAETVEKIDLRGTDIAAPGDILKRGVPVIDATAITDHKVIPINADGTHACAKFIRIATGCRKYFAEFENISSLYRPTLVQDYIQGDVNDDGKVSVADVMNVYDQLK